MINNEKFTKIKGLVNRADCIRNELILLNYFEPVDAPKNPTIEYHVNEDKNIVTEDDNYSYKINYNLLFDEGISDEEKINFINNFGERLSYICELYLKALIIPNMHFEDIENESDEELDEIINGNRGIKKKYSHYFKKLLSSPTTNLPNGLRKYIFVELGRALHDDNSTETYGKYTTALLNSWINGEDKELDEKKDALEGQVINNSIELTDSNSDSYPQSRYSMFTDYIADIDYLFNLCEILYKSISQYLKCCLDEPSIGRHIFPDLNSIVVEKLSNGHEVKYYINSEGKIDKSNYYEISDLFPGFSQSNVLEISYTESGIDRIMKFDSQRRMFVQNNSQPQLNNRMK